MESKKESKLTNIQIVIIVLIQICESINSKMNRVSLVVFTNVLIYL